MCVFGLHHFRFGLHQQLACLDKISGLYARDRLLEYALMFPEFGSQFLQLSQKFLCREEMLLCNVLCPYIFGLVNMHVDLRNFILNLFKIMGFNFLESEFYQIVTSLQAQTQLSQRSDLLLQRIYFRCVSIRKENVSFIVPITIKSFENILQSGIILLFGSFSGLRDLLSQFPMIPTRFLEKIQECTFGVIAFTGVYFA